MRACVHASVHVCVCVFLLPQIMGLDISCRLSTFKMPCFISRKNNKQEMIE